MPIYKDPNVKKNPWYFAFEIKDENGKRKTIKKRGFKTKGEATEAEIEVRNQIYKGTYVKPSQVLFGDYIQNWLKTKQDLGDQARYNNFNIIKHHVNPHIGHIPLSKINVDVLENYIHELNQKNLAKSSVKKIFTLVNTSLRAAVKKGLIPKNPVDFLDSKPKEGGRKVNCWTKEEVVQFLNGFEHRQKIIFILAIYTGMRIGEILSLQMKNIDFEQGIIHIKQTLTFDAKIKEGAKTASGNRSIKVPNNVLIEMRKHWDLILKEKEEAGDKYQDNDLFICTKNGTPFTKQNCYNLFQKLVKQTGVRRIRVHDLRHTCASLLFQTNPPTNPKVVQELLGHSSIRITYDLYSHMMPNMHEQAVNALDKLLSSSNKSQGTGEKSE